MENKSEVKKPAKKIVLKKAAKKEPKQPKQSKEVKCEFNFWKLANDLETVSFKLDSVKSVVELLAESMATEPNSGAAWAASEMIEVYIKRLEELSFTAMEGHRKYGKEFLGNDWLSDWV